MSARHLGSYLLDAAAAHPDRPAFRDAAGTVPYSTYRDESVRVAALLAASGVGAGDRVAIALPKGFPLYATIHAALLRNACYVPVDYTTPVERGRAILADAEATVLVTTGRSLTRLLDDARFAAAEGILVATLASDGSLAVTATAPWDAPAEPLPMPDLDPDGAAYILYTSGSTGVPKGVVQSQQSATAFVAWATEALALTPDDVVPQVASVTFDLSVFDIFAATRAAACLTPIHERTMMAPVNFCRAVAASEATVVYCVPSLVLRESKGRDLAWASLQESRLRHVVFAGEPIDKTALRALRPLLPEVPIHNWFGPTETNVCAFHTVADADLAEDGPVPIGGPCPYATFEIAWDDAPDADAPRTGELLVAGDTVLTAYRNRPEDTAARIVEIGGVRHYRTGDFVFRNARGELVFVGRRDRQVKVQGRRIQLDEIEAAFRRHLPTLEVACTLLARDGAEPLIAAAVVGEPVPDPDSVREAAADSLPLYMMPERIVPLAALPRNARGKIDYPRLATLLAEAP